MRTFFSLVVVVVLAAPASAYVDRTPTLGAIIKDSGHIFVLQVEKVSREKKAILFKKTADLKGSYPATDIRHQVTDGFHPREPQTILDWAEPGQTAVCFLHGKSALICIGPFWYEVVAQQAPWWTMTTGRAELSIAYHGSTDRLARAVPEIAAGKEVVITTVAHGGNAGRWQHGVVGFQKVLRGKECPIWRVKASLNMPGIVWGIGKDSNYVVGQGAVGAEEVPGLIQALQHADAKRRRQAADDLAQVSQQARPALPALLKACQDSDPLVRISAARAAGLIDAQDPIILTTLKNGLEAEPAICRAAALALGDLGADAKPAVGRLSRRLQHADAGVRWSAADALGRIGGEAAAAVPELVKMLKDPAVRGIAADALGAIGPEAKPAIPGLQAALKDADRAFAWSAAVGLVRIDPAAAEPAIPLFVEKLQSADERAQWDAMIYCSTMGMKAKGAAPAVRALVQRGDAVAACVLATIAGPEAEASIPLLIQVLSEDWDTSHNLVLVGPKAVPAVAAALKGNDSKKNPLLIKTLVQIGAQADGVVPALIEALKNPDATTRCKAAEALGGFDPKRPEAVAPLTAALKDDNAWVRVCACWSLIAIQGGQAKVVLPVLSAGARDQDFWIRRSSTQALGSLAAKESEPVLTAALQDGDAGVRVAASWARVSIGSATAKDVVPGLIAGLKDADPWTRQISASYLGYAGREGQPAVAALTAALKDEKEEVRKAAAEALKEIQKQ